MKIVTASRRQIVMAVLLSLAVLGAAMRYWADNPSMARDIGTLLLVLWLPAVGNLVGFVIRKFPRRARPSNAFRADSFTAHFSAELTPLPAARAIDPSQRRCTVVVGSEGFTARLRLPLEPSLAADTAQIGEFELLRPVLASDRLAPGTAFLVLAGTVAIAKGSVLETYFEAVPTAL